jgi:hypothetical protein
MSGANRTCGQKGNAYKILISKYTRKGVTWKKKLRRENNFKMDLPQSVNAWSAFL